MKIYITSVLVDDQEKALRFYTDVLGFVKKNDIPLGEARWLTVVSPDDPEGRKAGLEPDSTRPPGRSRRPSWTTGSRSPRSPSTTSTPSSSGSKPRRPVHAGAGRDGRRDHGGARRHLRQPDSDRQGVARTTSFSHSPVMVRYRTMTGG